MILANWTGPRNRSRTGGIIVLVTVSLVVLIGVAGLAIDGGLLMQYRRKAQTSADACALAAAIDLYNGKVHTAAKQTALDYASYNGFSDDGQTNKVTVHLPPSSGPNRGSMRHVEVVISRTVPTSFIRIVYPKAATAVARGVAEMKKAPSGAGLLLTRPSGDSTLKLSGSATISVTGGGKIVVNSNGIKAVEATGGSAAASDIDIAGGYKLSGSAKLNGTVRTGVPASPDPLAGYFPVPDPGSMPLRSGSKRDIPSGTVTLEPGVYRGGIDISGGSVTLQPGTYYMDDGDLKLSGESSLQGSGVTIYLEQKLVMSSSGTLALTAPSGGTYPGLVLWGAGFDSSGEFDISGGANLRIQGDIYAPNAFIKLSGQSGLASLGSRLIASWMELTGGSSFGIDYRAGSSSGDNGVFLVE